jgi:hypothetical protein
MVWVAPAPAPRQTPGDATRSSRGPAARGGFRCRLRRRSARRHRGRQGYIDVSSEGVRWLRRRRQCAWIETRSRSRTPWGGRGDGPVRCASGLSEPEPWPATGMVGVGKGRGSVGGSRRGDRDERGWSAQGVLRRRSVRGLWGRAATIPRHLSILG